MDDPHITHSLTGPVKGFGGIDHLTKRKVQPSGSHVKSETVESDF